MGGGEEKRMIGPTQWIYVLCECNYLIYSRLLHLVKLTVNFRVVLHIHSCELLLFNHVSMVDVLGFVFFVCLGSFTQFAHLPSRPLALCLRGQ